MVYIMKHFRRMNTQFGKSGEPHRAAESRIKSHKAAESRGEFGKPRRATEIHREPRRAAES
jgi:hypothetical protein